MSKHPEQQRLLQDTLAETAPPEFRTALLAETLRHARRRRRWRHAGQASGVLIIVMLATLLAWRQPAGTVARTQPLAPVAGQKGFQLIKTIHLPPDAVVSTENFPAVQMISTAGGVLEVATVAGGFRYINDAQLLMLAGCPVILVRTGPDSEELVFANPEDRKKLFGN